MTQSAAATLSDPAALLTRVREVASDYRNAVARYVQAYRTYAEHLAHESDAWALGSEMRQRFGYPRRRLRDRLAEVGKPQLENLAALEKLLQKADA